MLTGHLRDGEEAVGDGNLGIKEGVWVGDKLESHQRLGVPTALGTRKDVD